MTSLLDLSIALFAILAVAGGSLAFYRLKRRQFVLERVVKTDGPDEGRWIVAFDQETACLLREERHIVTKDAGSPASEKGPDSFSIERHERYRSIASGDIVASLPPKKLSTGHSLEQGHELLDFLQEVSSGHSAPPSDLDPGDRPSVT